MKYYNLMKKNLTLLLMIILISTIHITSAATVLHNTIKQAVWITFDSIKHIDKKSNVSIYYGEIEIVALKISI